MKLHSPITVLVTGVGAIIGQGIIKSLRLANYSLKVIGVDRSDQSPGPFLSDVFYKKPDCAEDEPDYLNFWIHLLRQEDIDLVLPGLEVDVCFFNTYRETFQHLKTHVVLNQPELIALSSDKWVLGKTLEKYGLPNIPSVISDSWDELITTLGSPPFLLKPRDGNGSRGIVQLYDKADFYYWKTKTSQEWMIQRIVGSDMEEYTVGVFGFGDGTSLKPIVFKRRLSKAGNTVEARVIQDSIIEQATIELTKRFSPLGPTNYQFRKEGNIAYLLEINPRFSSSNSLRSAFGFNEAEMAIDYFLFNERPKEPTICQGIGWRYTEDFLVYDCSSI